MSDNSRRVNVGTIGHIDHGKRTLSSALVTHLLAELARAEVDGAANNEQTNHDSTNGDTMIALHNYHDSFESENRATKIAQPKKEKVPDSEKMSAAEIKRLRKCERNKKINKNKG